MHEPETGGPVDDPPDGRPSQRTPEPMNLAEQFLVMALDPLTGRLFSHAWLGYGIWTCRLAELALLGDLVDHGGHATANRHVQRPTPAVAATWTHLAGHLPRPWVGLFHRDVVDVAALATPAITALVTRGRWQPTQPAWWHRHPTYRDARPEQRRHLYDAVTTVLTAPAGHHDPATAALAATLVLFDVTVAPGSRHDGPVGHLFDHTDLPDRTAVELVLIAASQAKTLASTPDSGGPTGPMLPGAPY